MGSRWARVGRGMLASGAAIFVAALFHVAGGGAAPGLVPVALSLAFATLASVALTTRRLSLWRLTVAVGLSQFLFHALFSLGGGGVRFTAPDGMAHLHLGAHLTMSAGTMSAGAMPAAHGSQLTPSMWLTHASAVLVTVVALRFGEQAFWGLFRTARVRIARTAERLVVVPVPVSAAVVAPTVVAPARLRDLGLPLARLRHRGPPAIAGAF
ncbi:hypothetical protein [Leifsonia shinshuensis]|uniref:hypothetical protein n=1 Tax=Leifsonia shinshuensis TaxID=150026 RepID=UPI00285622AA|nr:hypothetical protein [Leifsonia shinshuensis]MDR6972399.1 hypothetical protein [Leifsonia shinshuensis]